MTLTTHYVLDGTKVVAQYQTATNTMDLMNVMYFYYDEAGAPTGIKYNGNVYYFQKNLQGDIIRILNTQESIVATYTYDAWGNIISSTDTSGVSIGTKNPFRYRGYYYDTETGLYYLNSRYYDPQVGRFISADAYVSTGQGLLGSNMFAYCLNNPVNMIDISGNFPEWINKAKEWLDENIAQPIKNAVSAVEKWMEDAGDWLNRNCLNEDGSYSIYDNQRHTNSNFREQILSVTPSSPSFDIKENNFGLGSIEVNAITGGWETEHVDISLLDVGHAEASAEIKDGNINFGALASIWSPSASFSIGKLKIEIGAEIGAVGIGLKKVKNGVSIFGAATFGGMLSISLDDD